MSKISPGLAAIMRQKPTKAAKPASVLNDLLEELDWSGAELGRRLGKHPNTITWWMKNPGKIPSHVSEYLALVLSVKRLAASFIPSGRRRRK